MKHILAILAVILGVAALTAYPWLVARFSHVPCDDYPLVNELGRPLCRCDERIEQYLCSRFIPKEAKVLEIGGRYGSVSVCINKTLADPTQHVVVEPDPIVLPALKHNRQVSQSKFAIVEGVIGRKPLYLVERGYASFAAVTPVEGGRPLPAYSLAQVMATHRVEFDTLVVDCEGCFGSFWKENPTFFDQLKTVILENDRASPAECRENEQMLRDKGFRRVYKYFIFSAWRR